MFRLPRFSAYYYIIIIRHYCIIRMRNFSFCIQYIEYIIYYIIIHCILSFGVDY